jgi:hypothetical protein
MPGVLEFEVSLRQIKPRIWRRFQLAEAATFADLHQAIQDAFGWEGYHLWEFRSPDRRGEAIAGPPLEGGWSEPAPDAGRVPLRRYFTRSKQRCLYTYDFGDDWEHEVVFRGHKQEEAPFSRRLLAGRRACPPEDCGGLPGYERCVAVAGGEALDEDDRELAGWMGGWAPDAFSLKEASARFDRAARGPAGQQDEAALDALLADPPRDLDELAQRLSPLHRTRARIGLIQRLEDGAVPQPLLGLLIAAFEILGVGPQRGRLLRLLADPGRPAALRSVVFGVLAQDDPGSARALLESLDEDFQDRLAEENFRAGVRRAAYEPEGAAQLARALASLPPDHRRSMLESVEALRREEAVPAGALYAAALCEPALEDCAPLLLDAVAREDSPALRDRLELLRHRAPPAIGAGLAALLAREAGPRAPLDGGPRGLRALVSSCDGQGAFNIFLLLEAPCGTRNVAAVCLRAAAGVREAYVVPDPSGDGPEGLAEAFSHASGIHHVAVPVGEAVALIEEGVALSRRLGQRLPADARAGVELALSLPPDALPGPPPLQLVPDDGALEALLRREQCAASWFFDLGDLRGVGAQLPPPRDLTGWTRDTLERMDRPEVRARLAGICRHMARWRRWSGDAQAADTYAFAARAAEGSVADHPLARRMLAQGLAGERRLRLMLPALTLRDFQLGVEEVRATLRDRFCGALEAPTAGDLATLDFAEVAYHGLDLAETAFLRGDRRLRRDHRETAAWDLGEAAARTLLERRGAVDKDALEAVVRETLEVTAELMPEEAAAVAPGVAGFLGILWDQVCAGCPVGCFSDFDREVTGPFFAQGHPSGSG